MRDLREEIKNAKFLHNNLHKLVRNLSSEDYHALKGTFSSSQLKDMIGDEEVFIKKHIKKEIERKEEPAFDIGNYFHTGVLEPHKLKTECAVFPGKIRRGKDWEKFKANNKGKAIVTPDQKEKAEGLVRAVKNSPIAQKYLDGEAEVSLFTHLVVFGGQIYAPKFGKVLTREGWQDHKKMPKKGYDIYIKVRADNLGDGYISDLKSTSSNARCEQTMRHTISKYVYDLSASLYLDMFSLVTNASEFYWIFASKELFNSKTYRATEEQILVGRAKYMKAIFKIADCAANNWELADYLGELAPLPYEMEWLVEKDTDLL